MDVETYYKKDCTPDTEPLNCRCIPSRANPYFSECSFYKEKLITNIDEKFKIFQKFGKIFHSPESYSFIRHYPVFILRAGTTICHSTDTKNILQYERDNSYFVTSRKTVGWWNKYYVGHSKYRGGWFTYETGYGGPTFGMLLYYRVKEDIPILFIPNHKVLEDNPSYYPDKDFSEVDYENLWSGSHVVQGAPNWKALGYKKIVPKYYADELANRLLDLNFPGYISCDECEVFLAHSSMKKALPDRPYRIVYERTLYARCKNCKKKTDMHKPECEKCSYKRDPE